MLTLILFLLIIIYFFPPTKFMVEVEEAGEAFAKQLDSSHKVNCPWKGNSCPESLVQFPPTPQSALIGGYKDRCDGLLQFQSLPIVATCAIEQMRVSRGPQVDRFLSQSQNLTTGEVDVKSDSIPELETSRDGAYYLYSRVRYIYVLAPASSCLLFSYTSKLYKVLILPLPYFIFFCRHRSL